MAIKKQRGGARPGSGRPKGELTIRITFRINKNALERSRAKFGAKLNKMANEWIKSIILNQGSGK
jgi:hypothetical protein